MNTRTTRPAAAARAGLAMLATAVATPVRACTLCDSVQAVPVRSRLLGVDLWWNACAVALPLVLLLAIIVWIAHEPAGARKREAA